MLSVKEVCEIYHEKFPERKIVGLLDVGDEYVIRTEDNSDNPLYTSPVAISKKDGSLRVFFPPANREKLKKAVPVEISE